jgi:hypothetical protein
MGVEFTLHSLQHIVRRTSSDIHVVFVQQATDMSRHRSFSEPMEHSKGSMLWNARPVLAVTCVSFPRNQPWRMADIQCSECWEIRRESLRTDDVLSSEEIALMYSRVICIRTLAILVIWIRRQTSLMRVVCFKSFRSLFWLQDGVIL